MVEVGLVVLILIFGFLGFVWSTEDLVNFVIKTAFLSVFLNIVLRLLIYRGYIQAV